MTLDINTIKVEYESTTRASVANEWLKEISTSKYIACDFEAAVRYTEEDKLMFKDLLDSDTISYLQRRELEATLQVTALDHPEHVQLTHLSIAVSPKKAYVFILSNEAIRKRVLNFLVTTDIKQIWHNASFDFKHIIYHTGKMPKNYEDTQIYLKTLINHVNVAKSTTGLKEIAGHMYGSWGLSSDNFTLDQMYDPTMLQYAATDACATFWVYEKLEARVASWTGTDDPAPRKETSDDYAPWDQFPAPSPINAKYAAEHFYHNTAKFLIRDTVRIMDNGLPISLEKVKVLEDTLVDSLEKIQEEVDANPTIKRFMDVEYAEQITRYKQLQKIKMRSVADYLQRFDSSNITHISYFMNVLAERVGLSQPEAMLPTQRPKWTKTLALKFANQYPIIRRMLEGELTDNNIAHEAMELLAKDKANIYNAKYLNNYNNPSVPYPKFNIGSPAQKKRLFAWLGLTSETTSSTTKEDSWNRAEIERVNKETDDEEIRAFTQSFIDHSFAAIVKNNFIQSFYKYTVNGKLHGQYKLLGAKSG